MESGMRSRWSCREDGQSTGCREGQFPGDYESQSNDCAYGLSRFMFHVLRIITYMRLSNLFFILMIKLIILLLILICSHSHAVVSPDSNAQLMYAEQLFDNSLYEASILEFKRYIFYNPESDLIDYAYYKIGQAYYTCEHYDDARQNFTKLLSDFPESPLRFDTKMMLAKTYYQEHNYPAARNGLQQMLAMEGYDKQLRIVAQYMQGWCYFYERNWYSAIIKFREVSKTDPDGELGKLAENLADITLSGTRVPRKSSSFARWMSRFIPGSGQIYTGHFLNGLGSMLLNGAFIYLLTDSIVDKRYVDAIGIYLVGARFYFGNIYNAEKFAIDYNRQIENRLIKLATDLHRTPQKILKD